MIISQISTNDFILQVRTDFITGFDLLIAEIHPLMSTFAGILVLIFVVYKVVLYMINPDKGLDPYVVIRPCLILAGIVLYKSLVDLFMIRPMQLLANIIEEAILNLSGLNINGFDARFDSSMTRTDDRLYDVLQVNPLMELIHLFIYFVGSFVAAYMLIKQALTMAIYYVMGYFSMIFSLIPGNDKSFFNWGLSFLAVLLWTPFIMILKYLIILTRIDTQGFTSFFVIVAIQISSIFMFFKIPRLCEFLINGGSPLGSPYSVGGASSFRKISSGMSGLKSLLKSKK